MSVEIYYAKKARLYLQINRWDWDNFVYIIWLVILLNNAPSLSMLVKHNKNKVLTCTMWNIMNSISISKIIDSMNIVLLISNIK